MENAERVDTSPCSAVVLNVLTEPVAVEPVVEPCLASLERLFLM